MTVKELLSQLQNADEAAKVQVALRAGETVDISVVNIQKTETTNTVLLTTNDVQREIDNTEA